MKGFLINFGESKAAGYTSVLTILAGVVASVIFNLVLKWGVYGLALSFLVFALTSLALNIRNTLKYLVPVIEAMEVEQTLNKESQQGEEGADVGKKGVLSFTWLSFKFFSSHLPTFLGWNVLSLIVLMADDKY